MLTYASVLHYQAGKKHFPDFIDNAFGTNLTSNHSENFYADAKIKKGAQSLSLHTAENCFCTMKTYQFMMWGEIRNCVLILVICAIFLLTDHSSVFIYLCKLTVPIVWIKKAINYFYARHEFERLYKDIYKVLTYKHKQSELMAESIHILLQYETLKAWLNYPVSEKVFFKHRGEINDAFAKERECYIKYDTEK